MPNWVRNTMTVAGSNEAVEKFISDMSQPIPTFVYPEGGYISKDGEWKMEDVVFSFWNIIAPTDLEDYFTSDHWYNWNCSNWGVKWDAKCDEGSVDELDKSDGQVTYHFETPWGTPYEVFVALAEKYNDLEFGITWEEEQGFGAELVGCNGEISEIDSWDIPESHADYAERDNLDSCLCAYESDPENMYEDCPERVEFESNPNRLIPITDLTSVS